MHVIASSTILQIHRHTSGHPPYKFGSWYRVLKWCAVMARDLYPAFSDSLRQASHSSHSREHIREFIREFGSNFEAKFFIVAEPTLTNLHTE
jgi:hypothetical protein